MQFSIMNRPLQQFSALSLPRGISFRLLRAAGILPVKLVPDYLFHNASSRWRLRSGGSKLGPRRGGEGAQAPRFSRTLDTLWSIDSQKSSKFHATRRQILRPNAQNSISAGGATHTHIGGA